MLERPGGVRRERRRVAEQGACHRCPAAHRVVFGDLTETVRQAVTLGSPFALRDSRQSRVGFAYRRHEKQHRAPGPGADTSRPIPVPSTAIFSKRDGIVHWRSCVEPETELHQNVEVRCAHLAYGTDLASLWVVADRLAQPRPAEHPFTVPPSLRRWFPG